MVIKVQWQCFSKKKNERLKIDGKIIKLWLVVPRLNKFQQLVKRYKLYHAVKFNIVEKIVLY